jgi:hypothetical protein
MRDGTSNLAHDRPEPDGVPHTAQVLRFRPRERLERAFARPARPASEPAEPVSELFDDLAQFEHDREEEENINYPQRMLMNVIAVAVVTILIGVGVWLADTIADMERDQDCVLQGRQNCAPIEVPAPNQR